MIFLVLFAGKGDCQDTKPSDTLHQTVTYNDIEKIGVRTYSKYTLPEIKIKAVGKKFNEIINCSIQDTSAQHPLFEFTEVKTADTYVAYINDSTAFKLLIKPKTKVDLVKKEARTYQLAIKNCPWSNPTLDIVNQIDYSGEGSFSDLKIKIAGNSKASNSDILLVGTIKPKLGLNPGKTSIKSSFNYDSLKAGEYTGKLIYNLGNHTLESPINLQVKHAWPLPYFTIFTGLLVGFFISRALFLEAKSKLLSDIQFLLKRIDNSDYDDNKKSEFRENLKALAFEIVDTNEKDLKPFRDRYDAIEKEFYARNNIEISNSETLKKVINRQLKYSSKLVFWAKVVISLILAATLLNTNYVDQETFGSKWLGDYLKLLLAGYAIGSITNFTLKTLAGNIKPS